MTAAPEFSFITPTYQGAAFLPRCHWSLTRQTLTDWEWVVIDDGSTDGTADVIAALGDARIRYHRLPQNLGRGRAREVALRQARGRWAVIMDVDDLSLPDRLARASAARAEGFSFFCSAMVLIDAAYGIGPVRGCVDSGEPRMFPHATLCGDLELLRRIGYPPLRRAEDQTMVLTLANTARGVFCKEPLYAYHEAASITPGAAWRSNWSALGQIRALARAGVLTRSAGLRRLKRERVARLIGLLPFLIWPRAYEKTLRRRENFAAGAQPLEAAGRAFIAECARRFPLKPIAPFVHAA
ncbi:MAG: glycosyltransferase family 2 protein [Opitutaceae bacterium]|nr:glycosyltransferase family 2 protein [Opitutaceae bacterium]